MLLTLHDHAETMSSLGTVTRTWSPLRGGRARDYKGPCEDLSDKGTRAPGEVPDPSERSPEEPSVSLKIGWVGAFKVSPPQSNNA